MRVVFAGSAEFSIPVLRALAGSGHEVVEVLTDLPRTPTGKVQKMVLRDMVLPLLVPQGQARSTS